MVACVRSLRRSLSVPQATYLWSIDGETMYFANYGFRVGLIDPDTKGFAWKADAKNTDPGVTMRFGGRLAVTDGVLCWANNDGEILGLDPDFVESVASMYWPNRIPTHTSTSWWSPSALPPHRSLKPPPPYAGRVSPSASSTRVG